MKLGFLSEISISKNCVFLKKNVLLFRAGIKGLFVLMPILGVGWILGLFALNKGTIVFVYAFAIINGFQVRLETLRDLNN